MIISFVGLLLRLFSYLYDMDVIEEECFFKWKEDVSQEFPGKGQALFQVKGLRLTIRHCGMALYYCIVLQCYVLSLSLSLSLSRSISG